MFLLQILENLTQTDDLGDDHSLKTGADVESSNPYWNRIFQLICFSLGIKKDCS